MKHYGYYLFLGLGDFPAPESFDDRWTSCWDVQGWQDAVTRLKGLGTNTIFLYLMGHQLPYASREFPDCIEVGHPNVKQDFLQQILDRCRDEAMDVVAVFSTTGHARSYATLHPEIAIVDRDDTRMPQHGILCHHQAEAQHYPQSVIRECLTRYTGFSGIVLHPPEFVKPCFCTACCAEYARQKNRDLKAATLAEAQAFFMQTYMGFQRQVLEAEVSSILPGIMRLTFTIPWIFERGFEEFAGDIARDTVIVDWDYDLSNERLAKLQDRLQRYGKLGHSVWFMPTAGFDFSPDIPQRDQSQHVLNQIRHAEEIGIHDIIYFLGPYWYPSITSSSWFLANCRESQT